VVLGLAILTERVFLFVVLNIVLEKQKLNEVF